MELARYIYISQPNTLPSLRNWTEYYERIKYHKLKSKKGKGKDLIIPNSDVSFFKILYTDIYQNITSYFTLADATEIMLINKEFLLFIRNYNWNDIITPIYDIRLFVHVFPRAIGCKLSLGTSCKWIDYSYIGSHKIVFKDFSLLTNIKTLVLDQTFENTKTSYDLVEGFLSLPSSIKVIKIEMEEFNRIKYRFVKFIALCEERCLVIKYLSSPYGMIEYVYDPHMIYNNNTGYLQFNTLQNIVSMLVEYTGFPSMPTILPSSSDIILDYHDYNQLSYHEYYPGADDDMINDSYERSFYEDLYNEESYIEYLAEGKHILKTRKIKNNKKRKLKKLI